jgi:hypothetical protein
VPCPLSDKHFVLNLLTGKNLGSQFGAMSSNLRATTSAGDGINDDSHAHG